MLKILGLLLEGSEGIFLVSFVIFFYYVDKRLKMTNEEFNNQNGRQNSNIPFLSLT